MFQKTQFFSSKEKSISANKECSRILIIKNLPHFPFLSRTLNYIFTIPKFSVLDTNNTLKLRLNINQVLPIVQAGIVSLFTCFFPLCVAEVEKSSSFPYSQHGLEIQAFPFATVSFLFLPVGGATDRWLFLFSTRHFFSASGSLVMAIFYPEEL